MNVPFADLHAQYFTIKDGIDAAIADVIRTSAFIRGPYVQTGPSQDEWNGDEVGRQPAGKRQQVPARILYKTGPGPDESLLVGVSQAAKPRRAPATACWCAAVISGKIGIDRMSDWLR